MQFNFTPDKWFLVKEDEDKTAWPYSLCFRIDRSYKGKCEDVGIAKIYLDEEEAAQAKKEGFAEVQW